MELGYVRQRLNVHCAQRSTSRKKLLCTHLGASLLVWQKVAVASMALLYCWWHWSYRRMRQETSIGQNWYHHEAFL